MVMLKVSIPSQIPEELFHAKGVLVLALAHNKWVPSCQMFILLSSLFLLSFYRISTIPGAVSKLPPCH